MNKSFSVLLYSLCLGTCNMNLFAKDSSENQTPPAHQSSTNQAQRPDIIPSEDFEEDELSSDSDVDRTATSAMNQFHHQAQNVAAQQVHQTPRPTQVVARIHTLSNSFYAQPRTRPARSLFTGEDRGRHLISRNATAEQRILLQTTATQELMQILGNQERRFQQMLALSQRHREERNNQRVRQTLNFMRRLLEESNRRRHEHKIEEFQK